MTHAYFDRSQPIDTHLNQLPHWQQGTALQFVTWHLGDALPVKVRKEIAAQRELWLQKHPQPWDQETEEEYFDTFSERIQRLLDSGIGSCDLKDPTCKQVVTDSLHYLDGHDYQLDSYVVMPNHVHVMFAPHPDKDISKILQRIKRHTSFQINKLQCREGSLWMRDYWDRMIRGERHYHRVRRYIRENPMKAELRDGLYSLWEREEFQDG